jgi:hypothetical protein
VRSCKLGGAAGYSLEPPNAYRPNTDYYHRAPDLKWFRWVPERDWYWHLLWGRLAYDPDAGPEVFRGAMAERFGPAAAGAMLEASRSMSRVIPLIYAAHCQGPDHLNMAPEFETGGPLADFAAVPPLDTFAMQSTPEYVNRLVAGNLSPRTTPLEMADSLDQAVGAATAAIGAARRAATAGAAELADWEADVTCLGHLGAYCSAKIRAATSLELYRATGDPAHLAAARDQTERAVEAWRRLAEVTEACYVPFVESMRPLTEQFRWSDLTPSVEADPAALQQAQDEVQAAGTPVQTGIVPRHLAPLAITVTSTPLTSTPERKTFRLRVALRDAVADGRPAAYLLRKPLPSETHWRRQPLTRRRDGFEGVLEVSPQGAQWAVEVVTPTAGARWPDWRKETPYRVVEAWDGPVVAPQAGALPDLAQMDLSRRRYGAVLCGRLASGLNAASAEQKTALLAAVSAGQTLVLLNQDFPTGFDASWLPGGVSGTDEDLPEFRVLLDHPLLRGIPETVRHARIVNDALTGGDDGWRHLVEPWGLATRKHGEGEIILVQVNVDEAYDFPPCARLLRNTLEYARRGSQEPLLILDPGNGLLLSALDALGIDDYVVAGE